MARMSDEPLAAALMGNIRGCAKEAMAALGPSYAGADAPTIVEGIDAFAVRWQQGERPSKKLVHDLEHGRLIFGSLWGEQLCRQFGWEWAQVDFGDGSSAFGVVSPDRSMAIYPLDFMLACLENPDMDVTVALSFNMLVEGTIPAMPRLSYTDIMDGVQRIVPRE